METVIETIKNLLKLSLLALVLCACDKYSVYERNYDMRGEVWKSDSVLVFNANIDDTTVAYNILFNNRITGQYPYSNMYLFITITAPGNMVMRDTLDCVLADNSGKWLGKGFGGVWSNTVRYKSNILFPRSGNYTIKVEQAMRVSELPHVLDAGLRIERAH
ncbi:MAG: gliding motility lipoprotein GldH [Salinivirgaceae bacterium]|nr:gliding motility lipoprotein GldH [Salinivirgaceae bacterium]